MSPAYQRIKDYILENIHAGSWREGDLIPSEHELVRRFNVARMTVNRALRELTGEQVLTRVQGAGTFVAQPKYASTLVEIKSIADEIRARGHQHACEVLLVERCCAEGRLAEEFLLPARGTVFHSRLLHKENGLPIQLEERWANPSLAPDYDRQDFQAITPNEYLVRVAPLQRVEYRIEASLPDAATRRLLAMEAKEACLILRRRTWSKEQVASVASLWHPGGRYQFTGNF